MTNHALQPVYTPCSWSIDPVADVSPLPAELEAQIAANMADALRGRYDAMVTASMPAKRNRVAEEMGDEYLEGLDADRLLFIALMIQP